MRPALVLTFSRGHYAATPWGEPRGTHELPPSPWRLLRALYATWRNRCPELDAEAVYPLLARLATPPAFDIPRHGVRDGVVLFERDVDLAVHWPVDLTDRQHATLAELARAIPYLGRADSRCVGRLDPSWRPDTHESWSPVDVADSVPAAYAGAAVLAPTIPLDLSCLVAAPAEVRRRGLPLPSGTRLLGYQRDPQPVRSVRPFEQRQVTAVRFEVQQVPTTELPRTEALTYTDLLRQAALSQLGRFRSECERTVLGGRSATKEKLEEQHGHAHYLPLIDRGLVTGLLVWAGGGIPAEEVKALTSVRWLRSASRPVVSLRLAGIGSPPDLVHDLVCASRLWCSVTPFTPSRHRKSRDRWEDFVAAEVARELRYRGLGAGVRSVKIVEGDWVAWRRYRPSARTRHDRAQGSASRPSAFLRVELDAPVSGPLALGHLSHFGLGLFAPVTAGGPAAMG